MSVVHDFLLDIVDPDNQQKMAALTTYVNEQFPNLVPVIKWNQLMYTDHDTFILGISLAKAHFALAPEAITINLKASDIKAAGYAYTDNIIKIKWNQDINYDLIYEIISFNIVDKQDATTFFRK